MTLIDWGVIVLYFACLTGVVLYSTRRKQENSEDYFLAGRGLGWFVVGASIFASNIGSEHLVGLAGSGATDGVALAHYELHAWCLLVLGWVLAPFFMRSRVFTMPEFLERRFGPKSRWVLSIISLIAYVLTKIAVGIYAGGIVFRVLLPDVSLFGLDSFWIGSILVIVFTGAYTIVGGLRAVAYTEAAQTFILVIGSAMVTIFGLAALGGWGVLRESLDPEMFNLWKPLVPEGIEATWSPVKEPDRMAWYFNDQYPWLSMLFCAPVIGLWYWCTDQYIVQRVLGAKNETQARRGATFAAFLKILPVFIFIIPGMICVALAKSGEFDAISDVMLDENGEIIRSEAQAAFPLLVSTVLPVGIRGLVVAGLLAALMSSLAGVFNASATLFTMDFYRKLQPNISQERLVWVGRVATVGMVLVGLAWIPVIQGGRGLYDYLQGVQSYLAPPIFTVFFLGVFWKRLNGAGCLAALIVGGAMGLFRLAIDTPVKLGLAGFEDGYATGSFLWIVNNMFFQYYSMLILAACSITMIVVSYISSAPDYTKISGLAFGTLTEEDRRASRSSWKATDVVASAIVLAVIVAAYVYFSG